MNRNYNLQEPLLDISPRFSSHQVLPLPSVHEYNPRIQSAIIKPIIILDDLRSPNHNHYDSRRTQLPYDNEDHKRGRQDLKALAPVPLDQAYKLALN